MNIKYTLYINLSLYVFEKHTFGSKVNKDITHILLVFSTFWLSSWPSDTCRSDSYRLLQQVSAVWEDFHWKLDPTWSFCWFIQVSYIVKSKCSNPAWPYLNGVLTLRGISNIYLTKPNIKINIKNILYFKFCCVPLPILGMPPLIPIDSFSISEQ